MVLAFLCLHFTVCPHWRSLSWIIIIVADTFEKMPCARFWVKRCTGVVKPPWEASMLIAPILQMRTLKLREVKKELKGPGADAALQTLWVTPRFSVLPQHWHLPVLLKGLRNINTQRSPEQPQADLPRLGKRQLQTPSNFLQEWKFYPQQNHRGPSSSNDRKEFTNSLLSGKRVEYK